MLGTNDFQFNHPYNNAWSAAQGIAALVHEVRRAPIEPQMPVPPILIISPPSIQTPKGAIASKFSGAGQRGRGLEAAYAQVARDLGCHYFDAESVTRASVVDGVHLDSDQHSKLGLALVAVVKSILADS